MDACNALTVGDNGSVGSLGGNPGADLVHLQACIVTIQGLVQSIGNSNQAPPGNLCNDPPRPGHIPNSNQCVEIWAGPSLTVDASGIHNGQVSADTTPSPTGGRGRGWIDLFATGDISILGDTAGAYAVHNNVNTHGAPIVVKTTNGKVTAAGLAIQANSIEVCAVGGTVDVEAGGSGAAGNVNLGTSSIQAKGSNQS